MKKILFGFLIILLSAFAIKRITFTPVYRLMLSADAIVAGKVVSHDTVAIEIEITKVLAVSAKNNLLKGQRIKINHTNNATYKIKSARIADNTAAVFYINAISYSKNFNHTDRFSGIIPLDSVGSVPFTIGSDKKEAVTLVQYATAINQIKTAYALDKTGMIKSKMTKKYIYRKNKMTAFAKFVFDEVERERTSYAN